MPPSSSSSSSSSLGYSQPPDHSLYTIGRQIINTRTDTDLHKRSPPARSPPSRPDPHRSSPNHPAHPPIHLRAPSSVSTLSSTIVGSPVDPHSNPAYLNNHDLYSGLSSFTFGAPGSPPRHQDLPISPTTMDRTPRPSVVAHDDDVASQHTFGGHSRAFPTANSASSVRSSSRASSLQFSDSEDDLYGDHTPDTPEDESGDDVLYHHPELAPPRRRESMPVAIPEVDSAGRDREGSLATLRRPSRSLDDDLRQFNAARASADAELVPKSEPVSRAEWDTAQAGEDSAAAMEYDFGYIMDGIGSRRASIAPSYVNLQMGEPRRRQSNGGSAFGWWGARRPSTATTGSTLDDTFAWHIKHYDDGYNERRREWSFKRERADGQGWPRGSNAGLESRSGAVDTSARRGKRGMPPGAQEIWRCEYVGRFKVDCVHLRSTDPVKPPQQRLNIHHIIDPFSKGNMRGGPAIIVHRHSRAVAFSILRTHRPSRARNPQPPPRPQPHRVGIMLAPRKVQEQYTSTQTTSKLRSHGLLDPEDPAQRRRTDSEVRRETERERERERRRRREEEEKAKREKKAAKNKIKAKERDLTESTGTVAGIESSAPSSTATEEVTTVSRSGSGSSVPPPVPPKSASEHTYPPMPTRVERAYASMSPTLSATTTLRHAPEVPALTQSSPDQAHVDNTSLNEPVSRRSSMRRRSFTSLNEEEDDDDDDDDDDRPPPSRTPHSETYASLDASRIADLQTRSAFSSMHLRSPPGGASFPKNLLSSITRSKANSSSHLNAVASSSSRVPWMLTAPRVMQEESERQVQGVDRSFKSVGLLPTYETSRKTSRGKGSSRKGKNSSIVDVFERVPEESLYMLLPMWAGETDVTSSTGTLITMPLSERQYLLVYYVPFDEKQNVRDAGKKKQKVSPTSSGTSAHVNGAEEKTTLLSEFRVCARLVGYSDLCESGVRLPDEGLSVTGPLEDAMETLPPAHIRLEHLDDIVIGLCLGRDKGMEFLPEGLAKIGLCLPAAVPSDGEVDPEDLLSPIGLAAVEMAWAGCMALTSFGGM